MSDIYQFNVGGTTYNLANLGLLAPVQITLTADRLYNTGDQFIYTGLLYKATETIAQGTSITIGSNAQLADCVTKQISEINSNLSDETYVEVIADGIKTYQTILNQLFGLVNMSKINSLSTFSRITSETTFLIGFLNDKRNDRLVFSISFVDTTNHLDIFSYHFYSTTSSFKEYYNGTASDRSQEIPTSGTIFRINYRK